MSRFLFEILRNAKLSIDKFVEFRGELSHDNSVTVSKARSDSSLCSQ